MKKAGGGILNTKHNKFLQKSSVILNKMNTKPLNNYLNSSKIKLNNYDKSFVTEKSFIFENTREKKSKSRDKQSKIKPIKFTIYHFR